MTEPYWEPLAAAPLPPVVNGQWVKGVGGAAVWSAIAAADLAGYPSDVNRALMGSGIWDYVTRQFGAGLGARIQVGGYAVPSQPVSAELDVGVTLGTPWPNSHVAFFASLWPNANWNGFSVRSPGIPNGLAAGWVHISNTTTAQTFQCIYISFGT